MQLVWCQTMPSHRFSFWRHGFHANCGCYCQGCRLTHIYYLHALGGKGGGGADRDPSEVQSPRFMLYVLTICSFSNITLRIAGQVVFTSESCVTIHL